MSKLTVQVESFKPWRSNSLFIDIGMPEMHLRIREATVHESHGKRSIGLPAKPQISREGTARRDERGRMAYSAIVQFTDRATSDVFSECAIAALLESFPNAFDDGGPA